MRFFSGFLFFLLISIISFSTSTSAIKIPHIIVSVPAQKYFVERIGKGMFNVVSLITPQMDPHTFEPSPALLMECAKADIYFTLGVPFETMWLERIKTVNPHIRIIPLTVPTPQITTLEKQPSTSSLFETTTPHEHQESDRNPHVWLSPALILQMLPTLTETMSGELRHRSNNFTAEAELITNEIRNFQAEFNKKIHSIPEKQRVFLSYHPTWQHLATEFGLIELTIEVDGKEPNPKQLKETLDSAKLYGITTIFIDNKSFERRVKTIAETLHARLEIVDPLQEDWFLLMNTFSAQLVANLP